MARRPTLTLTLTLYLTLTLTLTLILTLTLTLPLPLPLTLAPTPNKALRPSYPAATCCSPRARCTASPPAHPRLADDPTLPYAYIRGVHSAVGSGVYRTPSCGPARGRQAAADRPQHLH